MVKYSNGLEDKLDLTYTATTVLESRYLEKTEAGEITQTGEELFRRVAYDISAAEVLYDKNLGLSKDSSREEIYQAAKKHPKAKEMNEKFYDMMSNLRFLPNSPTLMNAGNNLQQLSACFVLPIEDSMEGIYDTLKNTALVHKSGGGTGFSFSRLRPNGAYIKGTQSYTPGIVEWIKLYNSSTDGVKQGGKRRGANMCIVRANHPDALDAIVLKEREGRIENFNVSITFTDDELQKVKDNDYILMDDPREGHDYTVDNARNRKLEFKLCDHDTFKTSWRLSDDEKSIVESDSKKTIGKVEDDKLHISAKYMFEKIIDGAWKKGEPGIIFLDNINRYNATPDLGDIESTNPCGEQPLLPYESCNLGSINLSRMIDSNGSLDKKLLDETIRLSVRFLDNVIDRNRYPVKEIEEMTSANRKIGLGVMGFAQMLSKMRISYTSDGAVQKAEEIMQYIQDISKDESRKLAEERGAFPNFDKSVYSKRGEAEIRNATTTTIAPTGTLSIIAGTSSGIEPIFALAYVRDVKESIGQNLIEKDQAFAEYMKSKGYLEPEVLEAIAVNGLASVLLPSKIKNEIKEYFPNAHDVTPEQHIKVQAAFQKFTDNAVSKTINFPRGTKRDFVEKAYWDAYEQGCKGLTIYVDGSRDKQVLNHITGKVDGIKPTLDEIVIPKNGRRPLVEARIVKQKTPLGNAFVTLGFNGSNGGEPYECFVEVGKGGKDIASMTEAIGRLVSMNLKNHKEGGYVALREITDQLDGIGGMTTIGYGQEKILSVPDGVAKGLKQAYQQTLDMENSEDKGPKFGSNLSGNLCPDCGSAIAVEEGCEKCPSCGFTHC